MSSAGFYAVWALLGAAALALWAWSRRRASGVARPVAVLERLATGPLLRIALLVAVAFAGWHLFAR